MAAVTHKRPTTSSQRRSTFTMTSRVGEILLLRLLFGARRREDVFQPVVPLVARVLERLLAVVRLGEVHRKGPRPGPRVGVVKGHGPFDDVGRNRLEPFDHLQMLALAAG